MSGREGSNVHILVLSPHRDDACFSLALTLRRWLQRGHNVTLLNCFTQSAYAPLASIAAGGADRCRMVSGMRRQEDERFVHAVVAASGRDLRTSGELRLIDLDLEDAPIRLRCEAGEVCTVRHTPGTASARRIQRAVTQYLDGNQEAAIAIPAALGEHVDHCLVRDAAQQFSLSWPCAVYEEMPYAMRPGADDQLRAFLEEHEIRSGEVLRPEMLPDAPAAKLKSDLCALYASQIKPEEARAMADFTCGRGGERIWTNRAWRSMKAGAAARQRTVSHA